MLSHLMLMLALVVPATAEVVKPAEKPAATAVEDSMRISFPVERFQLDNGLTVILAQDRSVPMVSYHTWYRVGSRDEKLGVTGAAHMLEHMMFKGAQKYSDKDFERILHENGIRNNAFTTWDYTGYYQNLPSHRLELMMDVEVDRMRGLAIKPEALKSELEVVKEERRMRVDNNPVSLLREALFAKVFAPHPYNWPVIGSMEDITAYTPEKLRDFYDRFYVPNNAVLVLAGDFDIPEAKRLVQKYYGSLPKRDVPEKKFEPAAEPKKAQRVNIQSDVQNSTVLLAYKGVNSGHPDSFALDLAAAIIGAGDSSRIYRQLVYRDQIATSAGAYNIANADPGVFALSASMKPGEKTAKAEKVLRDNVLKLHTELVSKAELEKVKNQMMKDFVDGLMTNDGRAQALASNEILYGSYEKLFTDLEKYKAVTAKDIQRVAKQYLRTEREVVGVLDPKTKGKTK